MNIKGLSLSFIINLITFSNIKFLGKFFFLSFSSVFDQIFTSMIYEKDQFHLFFLCFFFRSWKISNNIFLCSVKSLKDILLLTKLIFPRYFFSFLFNILVNTKRIHGENFTTRTFHLKSIAIMQSLGARLEKKNKKKL